METIRVRVRIVVQPDRRKPGAYVWDAYSGDLDGIGTDFHVAYIEADVPVRAAPIEARVVA